MVRASGHAFGDWIWQRITAFTMAVYSMVAVVRLFVDAPAAGAEGWLAWVAYAPFKWFTLLFLLALIYHAQLGVKEILMDYVHNKTVRSWVQNTFTLALVAYAIWSFVIVWSI